MDTGNTAVQEQPPVSTGTPVLTVVQPQTVAVSKRGRPKGSKNKIKSAKKVKSTKKAKKVSTLANSGLPAELISYIEREVQRRVQEDKQAFISTLTKALKS